MKNNTDIINRFEIYTSKHDAFSLFAVPGKVMVYIEPWDREI